LSTSRSASLEAHATRPESKCLFPRAQPRQLRSTREAEDVSGSENFDDIARRGGVELHAEVKGLVGSLPQVMLTINEKRHAQHWQHLAIAIVTGIRVDRAVCGPGGRPGVDIRRGPALHRALAHRRGRPGARAVPLEPAAGRPGQISGM
jgi:hypothetical protein